MIMTYRILIDGCLLNNVDGKIKIFLHPNSAEREANKYPGAEVINSIKYYDYIADLILKSAWFNLINNIDYNQISVITAYAQGWFNSGYYESSDRENIIKVICDRHERFIAVSTIIDEGCLIVVKKGFDIDHYVSWSVSNLSFTTVEEAIAKAKEVKLERKRNGNLKVFIKGQEPDAPNGERRLVDHQIRNVSRD